MSNQPIARCAHDRTPLDFHGDMWICPKCGDEWSIDVDPAPTEDDQQQGEK